MLIASIMIFFLTMCLVSSLALASIKATSQTNKDHSLHTAAMSTTTTDTVVTPSPRTTTAMDNLTQRPAFVMDILEKSRNRSTDSSDKDGVDEQFLYYFGIGSNMLRSKIENRGFNGTPIEIMEMEPAVVKGHRLAFNMRGFPPLEPAMGVSVLSSI
jgi:hypothetical protein